MPTIIRSFADQVVETSSTTGTAAYSLAGAKRAYRTFRSAFPNANSSTYYCVRNATDTKWELNRGGTLTYGSPDTLTRSVRLSSNANNAVLWTADDLPLTLYVPTAADVLDQIVNFTRNRRNVMEWGGDPNGVNDTAAAIQAAHDDLPSTGGIIDVPPGANWAWASAVTFTKPVSLLGGGQNATIFRPQGNAIDTLLTVNVAGQSGALRDFKIDGAGVAGPTMTAVKYNNGGISDLSHLYIANVGTGLWLANANGLKTIGCRVQNVSSWCIKGGGGAAGSQFYGDSTLIDVVLIPGSNGNGLLLESGANALYALRLQTNGGYRGVQIQDTIGGGATRPHNLFFSNGNFDAHNDYNLVILKGWKIEFYASAFCGATNGPGIEIAAAGGASDIDGVLFDGCTASGNKLDGLKFTRGRNLRVLDGRYNANGWGAANTYAGVRVAAGARGLFEFKGNIAGRDNASNSGWGNDYNPQGYGLVLESGALADEAGCQGDLTITDNDLRFNRTQGMYVDTTVAALTRGRIADNNGFNPVGPSAIAVGASPFTYTAGHSPEQVYVSGGTLAANIVVAGNNTGLAAGAFQLAPHQTITVTYTVAPIMSKNIL